MRHAPWSVHEQVFFVEGQPNAEQLEAVIQWRRTYLLLAPKTPKIDG